MEEKHQCIRCGKCCTTAGTCINATDEDIKRWKKEKRKDILRLVDPMLGDLWIDERGAEASERCPFLRKVRNKNIYSCRIHNTKPTVCKRFPWYGPCCKDDNIIIPRSTCWL